MYSSKRKVTKIRIVYLIPHLGKGGSERQLYLLLKHLDKQKFNCSVVVFHTSPNETYEDELFSAGVQVFHPPRGVTRRSAKAIFLYQLLREQQPHIVHSWSFHDNPYAGLIGAVAGTKLRYGSLRGSIRQWHAGLMTPLARRLCLQSVGKIFVNCEAFKKECFQYGLSSEQVLFLPNCVESTSFKDESLYKDRSLNNYQIPPQARIIGTLGNMRRIKNQSLLIEGAADIVREFDDVRVVIAGQAIESEPKYMAELEERIKFFGLEDKVYLTGFVSDVEKFMKQCTVFCLTSDSEGVSNSLLEAMAAGCPVISTRVGGIPEIILSGENGLLIEPGNSKELAKSLRMMLNKPTVAKDLGQAGKNTVNKLFRPERIVKKLESFYLADLIEAED